MQINPKLIKNQFEKSFDSYDQNAIVQKVMAEKLIDELFKIKKDYINILELGSGTGLLTKELVKKINFQTYSANDIVERSKFFINQIIPNSTFYCGNAQKIKPSKKMDLIISNAMFQWFNDLEKISLYYKNILCPDGILAFSTFSKDNFKEIKDLTGLSLEYKSLSEIVQIFEKNFKILYSGEFTYKMNFLNPLELLAHMKNTGVNSLSQKSWSFKDVKDFCDKYKNKYPIVTLTYSPIIFICQKV